MQESQTEPGARRRRAWWWIGAAVLIVGGAVWVVAATGPNDEGAAQGPGPSAVASSGGVTPAPTATQAPSPTDPGGLVAQTPPGGDLAAGDTAAEVQLPPVGLDDVAEFGNEVSARIVSAQRVEGVGQGPGERSGPALRVAFEITNGSSEAISLDYVVVNLYGADGAPGSLLASDPSSEPVSGALEPGASASGTVVLRLPDPTASTATVTISYGAEAPTVVFSGEVAA